MTDTLKMLYASKLKYNCSFRTVTYKGHDFALVFLGCCDFLIISNFWGCVACGSRVFDFDTQEVTTKYKIIENSAATCGTIENILTKYERQNLKSKLKINFIKED